MSKPSQRDRSAWTAKRIDDAYAAAARGDGWKALSQAWNVTQPCALQWCQRHIPSEICVVIGQNGRESREPPVIRKYEFAKPKMQRFSVVSKLKNETCRKITYRDGDAFECNAPTENGKTYCPKCARFLLTLTDRRAPETTRAAIHPWSEEGAQRANRAKKSA